MSPWRGRNWIVRSSSHHRSVRLARNGRRHKRKMVLTFLHDGYVGSSESWLPARDEKGRTLEAPEILEYLFPLVPCGAAKSLSKCISVVPQNPVIA